MNKIIKLIKEKRHSLRWIISFALAVVSIMTLFIFASTITAVIRTTLISNSKKATEQSVNLAYLYLKNYHDQLLQRGSIIADEIQQSRDGNRAHKMEEIYQMNQDVVSVNIFSMDGQLLSHAPRHHRLVEESPIFEKAWFDKHPKQYSFQVSTPHLQDFYQSIPIHVVTIYTQIFLENDPYILVIDFNFEAISDFFSRVVIDKKGYVYIADQNGNVIYHPSPVRHTNKEINSVEELLVRGDGTYVTQNELYTVGYRTISHLSWRVIGISYLEDTLAPAMDQLHLNTMLILVGMLPVIGIVSAAISKYISQPITNMVEIIEKTERGSLDNKIYERRFNEVRKLSHSYNNLLNRINHLMQQVKEEQFELRKSEMNVLQAQINPHFLYNTLDSILWMSNRGDNKGASQMTSALGRLLRISLSKGENLIPLRKEIEHAESYLTIQKVRYEDQFSYTIHIDEGVEDYLTVKLIIQPFLENALYHGIERMVDEGHIAIRVKDIGEHVKIEIEDDGVGIAPDTLKKLNSAEGFPQSKGGIGINNVNRRLKIYFGDEYGVKVKSELDEGTVISIKFPKIATINELQL